MDPPTKRCLITWLRVEEHTESIASFSPSSVFALLRVLSCISFASFASTLLIYKIGWSARS